DIHCNRARDVMRCIKPISDPSKRFLRLPAEWTVLRSSRFHRKDTRYATPSSKASRAIRCLVFPVFTYSCNIKLARFCQAGRSMRSEEHTSELQSQSNLVCRLLLEKKKK